MDRKAFKIMKYYLLLKSHLTDTPDFEQEIESPSKQEAIDTFYNLLHGEIEKSYIESYMLSEDQINEGL